MDPMGDTLIYQPSLRGDEDLIITSVLIPRTCSALITPGTACIGDSMPSRPLPTGTANITSESAYIDDVTNSSTASCDIEHGIFLLFYVGLPV